MLHQGQIYRWITPLFLHSDFLHILVISLLTQLNATGQIIVGFQLEKVAGPLNTMGLYFISGVGGILMSSLAVDTLSVGASCAIFGLIGGIFAYYIMNWRTLDIIGQTMKCCLCCVLFIILVYTLLFTSMVGFQYKI